MNFINKLNACWHANNSLLCVGLDPNWEKIPEHIKECDEPIFEFCKAIIDATHDLVCAYKPQIAYFAGLNAEDQLETTLNYLRSTYPHIPIILDSKGKDSAQPFLDYKDKGTILLCRTSNPGAKDIQDLEVNGQPVYEKVATMISQDWNTNNNCSIVVGATWPEQMKKLRSICGEMPFLVPGVGAQGGDIQALVKAGQTANGTGLMINSSRAVLYASSGTNFVQAARKVALDTRDEINKYRTN